MTQPLDKPNAGDLGFLSGMHERITKSPGSTFSAADIAADFGLTPDAARTYLDYLADPVRECEPEPRYKGVAEVLLRGESFYEALSDNPDVRRDYDYRATNEGGRDLGPKAMFYYMWAWLNMVERKCERLRIANNRTVLIANDCRFYPPKILDSARRTALLRGYRVVFALADHGIPSSVSSYSHAVRVVKPAMAVFITASHVSRPVENTVVGAKVSMLGSSGKLESLSTGDIKATTAAELQSLKSRNDLHLQVNPVSDSGELAVLHSHTRLAAAATHAALGRFPGVTLYSLAQTLKTSEDIDATLSGLKWQDGTPPFSSLKVVIEAAHTSSGLLAQDVFRTLGAQTTLLHGDVQPIQGFHAADPSITDNLAGLFETMTKQGAQMGLAFDLDGDRGAIVLPSADGRFTVLAPDKLGQVLMPFLMNECGYSATPKPLYIRDCLSTDALVDQGRLSRVTVETTDAGYVFLKKRERDKAEEGFLAISMGEASGHAWLDCTGPFENPIVVAALFAAMCVKRIGQDGSPPPNAMTQVFDDLAIPYRKSSRFQPLFSDRLIAAVAASPENDTGWSPEKNSPIPQRLISLCRSAGILKLQEFFTPGRTFPTPLGELKVDRFETQWDDEEKIYRFGRIYFLLNGAQAGSFVSRGSSNDPTAVQVWEVREFDTESWNGVRLSEDIVRRRFDLMGGLVLSECERLGILELVDRKPAANMAEVLVSVRGYNDMMKTAG